MFITPRALTTDQTTERTGHDRDDAMTRSEERLNVHTESQPTQRIRLHRYVETDYVQVTVPVRREKVRLEREPASTDREATTSTADVGSAAEAPQEAVEHEIILHEERPVISMQTVPVERVYLSKETVSDTATSTVRSAKNASTSTCLARKPDRSTEHRRPKIAQKDSLEGLS
jgi:stress response protein YsnF